MPAQLVALTEGPSILLDKPILLFGRHPECDIQLNSRKVSRKHCVIAQVNDYLVVRDLGSTNGVRINGVRVLEGRLKSGDELTIGNFKYTISWDGAKPAVPRADAAKPAKVVPPVGRPTMAGVRPEDDELLESSDEPVPLGEESPSPPPKNPPPLDQPFRQMVIPENLGLAPADSSQFRPPRSNPSV